MIRPAIATDAPAIAALWNWMIRETLATFTTIEKTVDDVESLIAERPDAILVADGNAEIDGFATFGQFRPGPGYAATVEHTIILRPAAQGAGLGARLLAELEATARGAGHYVMIGAISSANPRAVAFHETLGFQQCGCLREAGQKAGRKLDLIFVQKILQQTG